MYKTFGGLWHQWVSEAGVLPYAALITQKSLMTYNTPRYWAVRQYALHPFPLSRVLFIAHITA